MNENKLNNTDEDAVTETVEQDALDTSKEKQEIKYSSTSGDF